jgi:hypothetical protein
MQERHGTPEHCEFVFAFVTSLAQLGSRVHSYLQPRTYLHHRSMFKAFETCAGFGGQVAAFVVAGDAEMGKAACVFDLVEVCLHLSGDSRVF